MNDATDAAATRSAMAASARPPEPRSTPDAGRATGFGRGGCGSRARRRGRRGKRMRFMTRPPSGDGNGQEAGSAAGGGLRRVIEGEELAAPLTAARLPEHPS